MTRARPTGTPTLVALHGHGDDEASTRRWALAVAPPGWLVETPGAPVAGAGSGDAARSWFGTGPRGADPDSWRRSRDVVAEAVAAAAARGPVVVAGFSQGAAMALSAGGLPGLDAVVGICAFLPELDGLDLGAGPPAMVLGGASDEVVPAFLAEDAAAAMAAAGRPVTAETLPGGHAVEGAVATRVRSWLADRFTSRLRVSLGLPVDRVQAGTELCSGAAIAELSAAWERLGFDAAYVTDHPAPDDRWLAGGGHHALEPTVALAVAATATTGLLLHTHVYILGYRNPFLAAKSLASLDVVSGGRLVLGVAAGYLRAEFEALGAAFEGRGDRLDAELDLLARIWSEDGVAAEGPGWSARSVTARPRPAQHPHPPVWVGGNSLSAMRRAVRRGQGWSPFPTPGGLAQAARTSPIAGPADLGARLERFGELCEEEGPADRPVVCFSPFGLGDYLARPEEQVSRLAEEAEELFEAGVDWLALSVPGLGRSEVIERAAALAEHLGLGGD